MSNEISNAEIFEEKIEELKELVRSLKALGNSDLDFPLDNIDQAIGDLMKIPKDQAYWSDYEFDGSDWATDKEWRNRYGGS